MNKKFNSIKKENVTNLGKKKFLIALLKDFLLPKDSYLYQISNAVITCYQQDTRQQCTMHRSRDNIPSTCDTCNMAAFPSLVERLKEELECSVCRNVYTDPKTLPCLHTFCCHCLNQLAERRVNREPIPCPDCRTEINLPPGSNFDSFPSSFYLNRLRDIVSVQHEGHQVLCGSCDKKSIAIAFCFSCECFICAQCRDSHSQLKITKDHRMTAFDQIQDTDVQGLYRKRRPRKRRPKTPKTKTPKTN